MGKETDAAIFNGILQNIKAGKQLSDSDKLAFASLANSYPEWLSDPPTIKPPPIKQAPPAIRQLPPPIIREPEPVPINYYQVEIQNPKETAADVVTVCNGCLLVCLQFAVGFPLVVLVLVGLSKLVKSLIGEY